MHEVTPKGPFTVWIDYGCEGWRPNDFATLQEAVAWDRNGNTRFVITKPANYVVQEVEPEAIT